MSLFKDSASLERQLKNRIEMIKSNLHGVTGLIRVRKELDDESLTNDAREKIQTDIIRLEERKAKLETEKADLEEQVKKIKNN